MSSVEPPSPPHVHMFFLLFGSVQFLSVGYAPSLSSYAGTLLSKCASRVRSLLPSDLFFRSFGNTCCTFARVYGHCSLEVSPVKGGGSPF